MDQNSAQILGAVILAALLIVFVLRFSGKTKFKIKTLFGEAEAEGTESRKADVPGGVRLVHSEAGRDLHAKSESQGGVTVQRSKAKRDILVTHSPQDEPPK